MYIFWPIKLEFFKLNFFQDFSRTCDVSADATGILNDSDTIDQEVLAAEMADKEMEDTKEMED